jgi:CDP-diacylglycerol--inositol 3-phosphatidyltransferase
MFSYILDAIDGPLARYRNETSKFGAVLDMVTDRVSTAVLLALLSKDYPIFLAVLILDISAHWTHMFASCMLHNRSHKEPKDKILKWYYKRHNLFAVCFLSELFLCSLYVHQNISEVYVHPLLMFSTLPVFVLKQVLSLIHLVRGSQELVNLHNKLY